MRVESMEKGEKILKGIPLSPGIGIGTIYKLAEKKEAFTQIKVKSEEQIARELARLEKALAAARTELEKLTSRTRQTVGEKEAEIFRAHLLILEDPMLKERITSKIKHDKKSASWAVSEAVEEIAESFELLEEDYFRASAVDVRDIGNHLLAALEGQEERKEGIPPGSIIAAKELTPSETACFSSKVVTAIITEKGGPTGHAAIVARALGLPALSGIPGLMDRVRDGDMAIVNGTEGVVYLNPSQELVREFEEKRKRLKEQQKLLAPGGPTVTRDGRRIELAANIREPKEAEEAFRQGAEGIGLFRTEFLFINRDQPPGEEEQLEIYRKVLELMKGRPVVVRTLDIGGDKPLPYLSLPREENPFLGLRGIRLTLKYRELFKTQLKALLRASCYGNLKIMYPMVASIEEIQEARKILEEAKQEVDKWGPEEIGIMIETPAAALAADILARELYFFSIGTNDLTQYTLAVDRGNEEVTYLYDPYHPAVLRLIYNTVEAAHKYNRWVGLCGELGGEIGAAPLLVGLGLDEISMSPIFITQVKQAILDLSYEKARELALKALKASRSQEVRELLPRLWN